jgi:hypothetical protein
MRSHAEPTHEAGAPNESCSAFRILHSAFHSLRGFADDDELEGEVLGVGALFHLAKKADDDPFLVGFFADGKLLAGGFGFLERKDGGVSGAGGFFADLGQRLELNRLRIAVFGSREEREEIASGRSADVGAIDRLLNVAEDIGPGRDVLVAKIVCLSRIASGADELSGRERIEDLAAGFSVCSNRPLLGEPDFADDLRALGYLQALGLKERRDFRGDGAGGRGSIERSDFIFLGRGGQREGQEGDGTITGAMKHRKCLKAWGGNGEAGLTLV